MYTVVFHLESDVNSRSRQLVLVARKQQCIIVVICGDQWLYIIQFFSVFHTCKAYMIIRPAKGTKFVRPVSTLA